MAKQAPFTPQPSQAEMQPVLHLFNSGKMAEAELAANKLVKRYPNTFILYQILGIAQDSLAKPQAAIASYKKALSIQPNTPDLHFNLGIALTNTGELQAASHYYQQAIALQPNFFEAYGNLGALLQKPGTIGRCD